MNRRAFTVEAAVFLLGGAAISISGCGGGGSPTASTPPPPDRVGTVDTNHGHTATITSAQQVEGGAVELDIRGTSSHTHKVTLSADDVASVRSGRRVEVASTGSSHSHRVVFNG
jgi:hypothetical protein